MEHNIQIDGRSVLRDLECQVCLLLKRGPIYQCENGHLICSDDKLKHTKCPTCKVVFGKIRNRMAENLLLKVPTVCKYHTRGCKMELIDKELDKHEKVCPYCLVPCLENSCNKKDLRILDVVDHVKTDHGCISGNLSEEFSIEIPEFKNKSIFQLPSVHFSTENNDFFLTTIRTKKGLWYSWIYGLDREINEKLEFELQIISEDNLKLSFSGRGSSFEINPITSIIKEESFLPCLILNDSLLKKFATKNKLSFKISIITTEDELSNGNPSNIVPSEAKNVAEVKEEETKGVISISSNEEKDQIEVDIKEKANPLHADEKESELEVYEENQTKDCEEVETVQENEHLSKNILDIELDVKDSVTNVEETKFESKEKRERFLSKELSDVVGRDKASLKLVMKKVWIYIKNNNLQDKGNKQVTICDEKLSKIVGQKKFKGFDMKKYLKAHMFKHRQQEENTEENEENQVSMKEKEEIDEKVNEIEIEDTIEFSEENDEVDFCNEIEIHPKKFVISKMEYEDGFPITGDQMVDEEMRSVVEEIRILQEQEWELERKIANNSLNRAI